MSKRINFGSVGGALYIISFHDDFESCFVETHESQCKSTEERREEDENSHDDDLKGKGEKGEGVIAGAVTFARLHEELFATGNGALLPLFLNEAVT